jgi:hypothetical protein
VRTVDVNLATWKASDLHIDKDVPYKLFLYGFAKFLNKIDLLSQLYLGILQECVFSKLEMTAASA